MRHAARDTLRFLGEALHRCVTHSIDTQSAALAYYTLFSLAPVLLVVGTISRRFLGEARVHDAIVRQLQGVMGRDAGVGVAALLESAAGAGMKAGPLAIVGIVAFVLGSMAVSSQLQEALNRVWEVAPQPGPQLRSLLRRRLVSFVLVLAVGFLLLLSLTLSVGLVVLTDALALEVPVPVGLVVLANEILSFSVLTVLIALIYRVLPDARLEWRDVGTGAVVTSTLFSIGKGLIAFYLGKTTVASRFGVAGVLVAILLWVYLTSYIVLFGAELTAVYSRRSRRGRVEPQPGARHAGVVAGSETE